MSFATKSFPEIIKELRNSRNFLLREVAASLQIDPSLLSRIEHGDKRATREQVIRLAEILGISEEKLLIHYLRDRVIYELKDEALGSKVFAVAEKRMSYLAKRRKHLNTKPLSKS